MINVAGITPSRGAGSFYSSVVCNQFRIGIYETTGRYQ